MNPILASDCQDTLRRVVTPSDSHVLKPITEREMQNGHGRSGSSAGLRMKVEFKDVLPHA